MRRLLEDFDTLFDLGHRVGDLSLHDLVQHSISDLESRSFDDWGLEGERQKVVSKSERFVHFHYRPHLFPGMELKLRLAHELQFSLLPRAVPVRSPLSIAAVLESFCHLSGDLFGWQMLRDGKFLLWVVDMAGHGLRAGLASAVLYVLIDNLRERSRLVPLVSELNQALNGCIRPGNEGLYATGFFMTVDGDGQAAYCSAGHPPILLRRASGRVEELESLDRPIGLFPDTDYRSETFALDRDDCLLLYTDGLVEAKGRDGKPFGGRRLREILGQEPGDPRQLATSLYEHFSARQDIDKLEDDVTFLAARFR